MPELEQYLPGLKPPLEAQLIDLADEIAYNTADLDDGFSAGLFPIEDIAQSVPMYGELLDHIEVQFPGASDRIRFQETLRRLIDALVSGLIEGTSTAATEAGVGSVEDVRGYPWRLAVLTPAAHEATAGLKTFLRGRVYQSESILAERERSIARLAALFEFFLAHVDRLPSPYREQAAEQPVHRVVCDYIAGMTDGFFDRTCQAIAELGFRDAS